MSRFDDSGDYDCEYNNAGELWWANVERAVSGKRGQAVLRDLETILLELPERKLISGALAENGQVCVMGALVASRRERKGESRATILMELEALGEDYNADTTASCGVGVGLTYALGWRLAYLNDEDCAFDSPEQRYEKILAWVRKQVAGWRVPEEAA